MSLYAKRLERGRFIWPSGSGDKVSLTLAQQGYLLDGIDWRNPQHSHRVPACAPPSSEYARRRERRVRQRGARTMHHLDLTPVQVERAKHMFIRFLFPANSDPLTEGRIDCRLLESCLRAVCGLTDYLSDGRPGRHGRADAMKRPRSIR